MATFSNIIINALGSPYTLIGSVGIIMSAPSGAIAVVPPTLVEVNTSSTTATAGIGFPVAFMAETYLGILDTDFTGSDSVVTLSVFTGPTGFLPIGGTISETASSGLVSFPAVILDTAGSYVLQAAERQCDFRPDRHHYRGGRTEASLYIPQIPQNEEPPSSVVAGTDFGFEVGAVDRFGNPTALTGTVSLTLSANPGGSTLSGPTGVTANGAMVSFGDLTLNKVGTGYTIKATDGGFSATTTAIAVTPAAATQLVIQSSGEPSPATVTAGQSFSMVVDVEDMYGNIDTNFTGAVTAALANNATATWIGPVTVNTTNGVVDGVATFSNLVIDTAGTYQLKVTSTGLTSVTSSAVDVTAATASQLILVTNPPATLVAGTLFGFEIEAEDQYGNPAATFNGDSLTATLTQNGGNARQRLAASPGRWSITASRFSVAWWRIWRVPASPALWRTDQRWSRTSVA